MAKLQNGGGQPPKKKPLKPATKTNPLMVGEYSRLLKKEQEVNSAIIKRALERQKSMKKK
jgi:hypothetical protein